MTQEKLKEEFVEDSTSGLLADRTVRARQKTVVFGVKFTKACRQIFSEDGSESDWLTALEQFGDKKLLALPEPALLPTDQDSPAETPAANEISSLKEKEEKIFSGKPMTVMNAAPVKKTEEQLPALIGFLVSYEAEKSGEAISIREGRWLISSSLGGESRAVIVIQDASVSEFHATVKAKSGSIEIADQMSELGTGVIRKGTSVEEKIESGVVKLHHGDELRLGGRKFSVCLIG